MRRELREPWLVAPNAPAMTDTEAVTTAAASMGLDLHADETGRARALLYAPRAVEQTLGNLAVEVSAEPAAAGAEVPSTMPLVFRARSVVTASGTFGHLRIFTFSVQDPAAFVAEFVRLVELLPADGLILDVRGNGGGHIYAGEFTLQTMTPRRITPEPVQFSCTPLNLEICRRHKDNPTHQIDLGAWYPSMDQAVETGSIYSSAFAITPEDGANSIGQRYFGPVVLVTDARCYSATDIFAAGFQDHEIGPVLGVDDTTGAGGANVWTHGLLKALRDLPPDAESPYAPLPRQADMRVAIRRTLRVGKLAGTPVEDLGVRVRRPARDDPPGRAGEQRRPARRRRRAAGGAAGPPAAAHRRARRRRQPHPPAHDRRDGPGGRLRRRAAAGQQRRQRRRGHADLRRRRRGHDGAGARGSPPASWSLRARSRSDRPRSARPGKASTTRPARRR